MHAIHVRSALLLAASLFATAALVHADEGMWLFSRPPAKQLKEKYGFDADAKWLEHLQKSCVRISTGGSGSIVSSTGLVMTNHHVGADMLQKLSTSENNLIEKGFYAKSAAEEVKCPAIEMEVLWSIEDVTEKVQGAAKPDMSPADANTARRKIMATIEKESEDASKLSSEVVTLYQGARYHLYKYKRYTDVRLVMAPEKGIAFYGGDPDNFEYPRFDLDMCFFRIYENEKPLAPEHYLRWSKQGVAANDLVFVAGHPGRTERLNTVAHLEFFRDVVYPLSMRNLWRREVQLATFSGRSEEFRRIAEEDYFSVQNSRKARTGIFAGLLDPRIMAKKAADEQALRAAVDKNPEWKKKWGDAWDQIATAEHGYAEFYTRHAAPGIGRSGLGSLFGFARTLVRLAEEKPKPSSDRLREYRDSNLKTVELQLYSPAPIYDDLEMENLSAGLQLMAEMLGGKDPMVVKALAGMSPQARAEQLVHKTKLKSVDERKRIAAGGSAAINASASATGAASASATGAASASANGSGDPMIQLALDLDAESRAIRKRYEDTVESAEREGYNKIAAAQFAVNGEDQYPDATFTLRLSYGVVKTYEENGKSIPPFTNFAGLFERSKDRKNQPPFEIPPRFAAAKDKLNPNTPFNFISTCDIIGGNSGSPVVDRAGDVVGLIFDGNIQSLILDIAFTEEQARAVSVDSRAILEAMRKVYDCGTLADEIERR
jgi:hypothetical protein